MSIVTKGIEGIHCFKVKCHILKKWHTNFSLNEIDLKKEQQTKKKPRTRSLF